MRFVVARRLLIVVSLVGLCSGFVVVGLESPTSASPAITSVVIGGTEAAPVVTVNGSGFGTSAAALGTAFAIPSYCGVGPFSGDDYGTNFQFQDNAVPWSAGLGTGNYGDNCIGVDFTSYSDTQVVFTFGSYYYPNSSYQLLAGDAFTLNVLGATISGNVPTVVSAAIPPVAATVTAGQDAVWSVAIVNPYSAPLTNVSATLHANANGSTPLGFDGAAMPGCSPGGGNSEVCTVADIPANTTTRLNVFVPTTGLQAGDTIAGDVTVASDTLFSNMSGSLGTVTIVSCGTACEKAVAAPGVPVSSSPSPPTATDPTKQTVTLPVVANGPAVPVTLQSTTPVPTETPLQKKLCPTAANQTHCSGQISTITASFGQYNNPAKPIKVTISAHWGHTIPPGHILMEKNTGGDPLFLLVCKHNALTGAYNTPCLLAETHTGTSAANNLVTYDTVLFTSLDIQFARRVSTGLTKISPPAAPTALTVSPGSTKATLTWKAPTVTNGAGVTSYVVTVLSGGVVKKTVTFSLPTLVESVTGLTNGTSYTFKVAAGNVAGTGVATAPSAAIVVGAPAAPAKPTVVKVASGSLKVTFVAPANNGATISSYTATCTSSNLGVTKSKAGAASPLTVTALTAGKTYTCTVKATNSRGSGPASAKSAAVTA